MTIKRNKLRMIEREERMPIKRERKTKRKQIKKRRKLKKRDKML